MEKKNIDNNIDVRLLKIEEEIQYLEVCALKTTTGPRVDLPATKQKPHLLIRRTKSTFSMSSNQMNPEFLQQLNNDSMETEENATET